MRISDLMINEQFVDKKELDKFLKTREKKKAPITNFKEEYQKQINKALSWIDSNLAIDEIETMGRNQLYKLLMNEFNVDIENKTMRLDSLDTAASIAYNRTPKAKQAIQDILDLRRHSGPTTPTQSKHGNWTGD